MGLGRATNTTVGQNLGADQEARAESAVWLAAKTAASVMVVVAVVAALFPEPIVGVLIRAETEGLPRRSASGASNLAFVAERGATGVWVGMALGNVVGTVAAGLWFTRGTWKERVIEGEDDDGSEDGGGGLGQNGYTPVGVTNT